jgi:hypothetical protein
VLKNGASETRDYIFAARKNGEEDEEWHLGEPESPIENNGLPEFHDELESVFDDEFYVGVGGFDLIIARRSRRTTRRRVK